MKPIQILLPDHIHTQLQRQAKRAGSDLPAYVMALLADMAVSKKQPISATKEASPSPSKREPSRHSSGSTKGARSNISVTIRWDLIDKGSPECIHESNASVTLAITLARLSQVLGQKELAKLTDLKVSRGPLVSRNPSRDYLNKRSGREYTSQPIPGANMHVLTNTSTQEKIEALDAIPGVLGLPGTLFEVRKHPKL
jgi:hypothetical protein